MSKSFKNISIAGVVILLLGLLLYTGFCNRSKAKDYSAAYLIPKDAAFVIAVDIPQMVGKVNFEVLKRSQRLQASLADAAVENPIFAEIMRNPTESGVDYYQPAYAAYIKNPYNPEEDFTAIIMKLTDKAAFEKVINRSTLQEKRKNDGFTSIQIDRLTTVGWNNEFAILGASDLMLDMDEILDQFFNLKPEDSVLNISSFKKAMAQKGDFLFWISTTGFMADQKVLSQFGLKGMPSEIISGNHVIGNLDFSKGKMSGLAEFMFKPELEARFNNFFTDEFNADFSSYVAEANRQGTFMFSLNLPGIYHYSLSNAEAKEGLEGWLENNGIKIDDLLRLFGGNFMLVNYQREGFPQTASMLATNVYRPDILQRYLDMMVKAKLIIPVSEGLYATQLKQNAQDTTQAAINNDPLNYHLIVQGGKLFVTDDGGIIEAVTQGGYAAGLRMKENANALMDGNFFHGQVDLGSLSSSNEKMSEFETLTFELNKKQLDFKVTLKDKSASALETILQGGFQ